MITTGAKSIGFSSGIGSVPSATLPPLGGTVEEILAQLQTKYYDLETLLETKANAASLKALIRYSPELISIEAQDIVLIGDVTIAQIIKDQNGTESGQVNAKITQIIGDKVRTGSIQSNNWGTSEGTAIDLDNSRIWMGGSVAPKLYYDGAGNLSISGELSAGSIIADTVTVGGVTLGTIKTNAATGSTHAGQTGNVHSVSLSQIAGDLDDISNGSTYFRSTAAENAGGGRAYNALDASYDYIRAISTTKIVVSASNPSNGVVFDSNGLRGYSGASLKFNISTSGDATFGGDVITGGQVYANGNSTYAPLGVSSCVVGASSASGRRGVLGANDFNNVSAVGVQGHSSYGYGVVASVNSGATAALLVQTSAGGVGITFSGGGSIVKPRIDAHLLKVYDTTTHALIDTFEYSFE